MRACRGGRGCRSSLASAEPSPVSYLLLQQLGSDGRVGHHRLELGLVLQENGLLLGRQSRPSGAWRQARQPRDAARDAGDHRCKRTGRPGERSRLDGGS